MKLFGSQVKRASLVQTLRYMPGVAVMFSLGENAPTPIAGHEGIDVQFSTADFAVAVVRRGNTVICNDITNDLVEQQVANAAFNGALEKVDVDPVIKSKLDDLWTHNRLVALKDTVAGYMDELDRPLLDHVKLARLRIDMRMILKQRTLSDAIDVGDGR